MKKVAWLLIAFLLFTVVAGCSKQVPPSNSNNGNGGGQVVPPDSGDGNGEDVLNELDQELVDESDDVQIGDIF